MINAGRARLNHDARKRQLNESLKKQNNSYTAFHDAAADPRHLEHLARKSDQ